MVWKKTLSSHGAGNHGQNFCCMHQLHLELWMPADAITKGFLQFLSVQPQVDVPSMWTTGVFWDVLSHFFLDLASQISVFI